MISFLFLFFLFLLAFTLEKKNVQLSNMCLIFQVFKGLKWKNSGKKEMVSVTIILPDTCQFKYWKKIVWYLFLDTFVLANLICAKRIDVLCLITFNNSLGDVRVVHCLMLIVMINVRYTLFPMRIIPRNTIICGSKSRTAPEGSPHYVN